MTLDKLMTGQEAEVKAVGGEGKLRQHFLDMGIIPGVTVKMVKKAPTGDPVEISLHGFDLTLRNEEAARIEVGKAADSKEKLPSGNPDFGYNLSVHNDNPHPGLGEGGKYHSKGNESPLPKDSILTFALVGQQNSGKTTLFNLLTGANHHVGNFPGVTLQRQDGAILGYDHTSITDLPGVYSLSPYSPEEILTREFILKEKPNAIINIIDANNIERNLYLTIQLMELGFPIVLALNMMDEVRGNGGSFRINEMERILGIPVVPVSAARNEGVDELVRHAEHIARYQEPPVNQDFCDKDDYGGAVHRCLHGIMQLIEDHAAAADIPLRFAANKVVEGDRMVVEELNLSENEKDMIEHIVCQMEEERGLDRAAAMADMRYSFINKLCERTVVKPESSKEYDRSLRFDRILTGKWTAFPIFLLVISLILWLTIDVLGTPLQNWLWNGISALGNLTGTLMEKWQVSGTVRSLIVDGIFNGVGSVVSFVPIIILLFFFLSLLEDSGYMSRIAFVTDGLLRRLGLSGRSIVPLLVGLGCSVPGIMAAGTLPSARDRKRTIMLMPFMSCSAKIPIYAFFSAAFFPGHGGLVLVCLYLLSILIGIVVALLFKSFGKGKDAAPFVMELPNYRLPKLSNVRHLLWDKTKDFLQTAFTVIFIATIAIWFMQSFDFRFRIVSDPGNSMLADIAGVIAPVFGPIGIGDWRIVTSLISGFLAKESVVSSMQILGAVGLLDIASAVSMLVFCLFYTPCVASISTVKRELGGRWALFMVLFQCALAWVIAFIAYNLTLLLI